MTNEKYKENIFYNHLCQSTSSIRVYNKIKIKIVGDVPNMFITYKYSFKYICIILDMYKINLRIDFHYDLSCKLKKKMGQEI